MKKIPTSTSITFLLPRCARHSLVYMFSHRHRPNIHAFILQPFNTAFHYPTSLFCVTSTTHLWLVVMAAFFLQYLDSHCTETVLSLSYTWAIFPHTQFDSNTIDSYLHSRNGSSMPTITNFPI